MIPVSKLWGLEGFSVFFNWIGTWDPRLKYIFLLIEILGFHDYFVNFSHLVL